MNSKLVRKLVWMVPLISGVVGAALVVLWQTTEPRGDPVPAELEDLDISVPFVRVSGMAHYPVVIRQTIPGRPFSPEKQLYVFPLFGPHDTEGRAVRVLVRTARKPDDLVSYEFMTLEGHVSVPTPDKVPFSTEVALGKRSDYFFTDDMVLLEPWRIEVEGEQPWERP